MVVDISAAVRPLISIVVPVFNEEDNIDKTYVELKRVAASLDDYRFEFLFTDNHSTDGTFAELSQIAGRDPRCGWRALPEISVSRNRC